jgi:hypothetical protein
MDLLELIKAAINTLPRGPHIAGLHAVLRHIEVAYGHLTRGQKEEDESAFTDAIYRTNQAFEGGIKEAYRVLEDKDPQKLSTHQIELYFEKHKVFRDRVLAQVTNYRTKWRNPSTHDHNLDFDEEEAFLAIVSVSAFAKLLIDQIAERLSFVAARNDVNLIEVGTKNETDVPLIDRAIKLLQQFGRHYTANNPSVPIETEAQLMGALAGFLSSVAPDVRSTTGRVHRGAHPYYVDLEMEKGDSKILIELKRGSHRRLFEVGARQLVSYMQAAQTNDSILFLFSDKVADYDVEIINAHLADGPVRKVHVLKPKGGQQFAKLLGAV